MKIELEDVSMTVTPHFEQTGSILAGTAQSRLIDVETSLEIVSPAPRETVAKLVATAERMCFLLDAIQQPHAVQSRTTLNGEPLPAGPVA